MIWVSFNTSFMGIIQNAASLGSDFTKIFNTDISNENSINIFFNNQAQDIFSQSLNSRQLVKSLNSTFSSGTMYLFGENKKLLGVMENDLVKWLPTSGDVTVGILGNFAKNMFYISPQNNEYDKKKKEKEDQEKKFLRRKQLYDEEKYYK